MNVFEQIKVKLKEASNYEPIEYDSNDIACVENQYFIEIDKAIEIVEQVEKEHNNGWIACKDKLPEENQRVICSLDNGSVFILDYYGGAFCGVFKYDTNEVIAWQPLHLPPAYKESEEG